MTSIVMFVLFALVAGVLGICAGAVVCGRMCRRQFQVEHEHGLPRRREMQRYMLMGLYCNPTDPRPIVHRPSGWGYTLNVRKEELALLLWALLATIAIASLLLATVPPHAVQG